MQDTMNFASLTPQQQRQQAEILVKRVANSLQQGREQRERQFQNSTEARKRGKLFPPFRS